MGERCRKLLALKLEGKSFAEIQADLWSEFHQHRLHLGFSLPPAADREYARSGNKRMTQDEIRKLLGGYATNALSAEERRILFEAALEDQELFNALAKRRRSAGVAGRSGVARASAAGRWRLRRHARQTELLVATLDARRGDTCRGGGDRDRRDEPREAATANRAAGADCG